MRKVKKIIQILPMMLLLLFSTRAFASSSAEEGPGRQLLRNLIQDISEINKKVRSTEDLIQSYTQLIEEYFFVPHIVRFSIGSKRIKNLSAEQLEPLQELFTKILVYRFLTFVGDECGKIQINESYIKFGREFKQRVKRNSIIHTLNTQVKTPKQSNSVKVIWKMIENQNESEYYFYDLVFEGISQLIAMRAEYRSLIRRKGMDGFISDLENLIEKKGQKTFDKTCFN